MVNLVDHNVLLTNIICIWQYRSSLMSCFEALICIFVRLLNLYVALNFLKSHHSYFRDALETLCDAYCGKLTTYVGAYV